MAGVVASTLAIPVTVFGDKLCFRLYEARPKLSSCEV
jgi:hypothetical protein